MDVTYNGPYTLVIDGVGLWGPDETKDVDDALGKALVKRPDFAKAEESEAQDDESAKAEEKTEAPARKTAKAPAKA